MMSFHGEFFWVDVIFFFSFTKFISCVCYFFFSFIFIGLCRKWKILFGKKEKRENVKGSFFFLQDLDAPSSSSLSSSQHSAVAAFFFLYLIFPSFILLFPFPSLFICFLFFSFYRETE